MIHNTSQATNAISEFYTHFRQLWLFYELLTVNHRQQKFQLPQANFKGRSPSSIQSVNLMFIGLCIIAIVDEWKTNLMSLAILFHLLSAQHVSYNYK